VLFGAVAGATAGVLLHLTRRRRAEAECRARLPVGAEGVIVGAEPFELAGNGRGAVLLLHGGGDTPQTLRYLAAHLRDEGYTVHVPLLPGHGRTLRHFAGVRADQWLEAARDAYEALRARHGWVAVVGLSMGGALAVRLAAGRSDVPALVLVAPYLALPTEVRRAAETAWLWGPFVPYVRAARSNQRSIYDVDERARSLAYGWFTPAAIRALVATVRTAVDALPRVRTPTLVVHSREDHRIAPSAAERAYARLGAPDKRLEWMEGAGHVLTVDFGRERIFALTAEWLARHAESVAPGPSA
jgi:carboxylesterase